MTDRWQKFTQVPVSEQTIEEFSSHCDEFLVHAVDVEGKASGIEVELVKLLAKNHQLPVTYAGGVGSFQDLETLRMAGRKPCGRDGRQRARSLRRQYEVGGCPGYLSEE